MNSHIEVSATSGRSIVLGFPLELGQVTVKMPPIHKKKFFLINEVKAFANVAPKILLLVWRQNASDRE